MADSNIKKLIEQNLKGFADNNFFKSSMTLFETLGYKTNRTWEMTSVADFKQKILSPDVNNDKLLLNQWKSAHFLFETRWDDINSTETEVTKTINADKIINFYWFIAIELREDSYTKSQLSNITREINKDERPVFVLFKYADKLTFAIIDRRLNKKDDNKDVLEKVTLIKDINYNKPLRAHLEILSDIAYDTLKVNSFVDLHQVWLKALSVTELNKKFYTELSNWFFWTMDTCQLSKDNSHKDNIMFGIRMVTRIIFDWFIKEKGLLSEKIFDKQTYLDLLKPEYKGQGDLYYKVILQNLFFGCLSKPMDRREFRSEDRFQGKNTGYDVNNLFRYAKYLNNPQDVINMFKDIPFLNGGLFECTDDKRNGKYIDCFTDNDSKNFLKISDDIFFLEEPITVDLSEHFEGNNNYKNAKVRGLFSILNYYKFTIDETTPVEEEIALDPELLGRVFENLLAAHNPETKTTARKSTGSYYTPREIVDYMCEQSLINYLKTRVECLNIENIDDKLEELLSYSENHSFSEFEVDELIKAVNEVKILDPACGSGAFPMGLLHKLVHVLSKLDPHNKKWKDSQIEKANQIDDLEAREEAIKIIEEQFNDNEMDYSRKLYLIQNCIFGVDIQPMATQISRLRFFISLIVDEKPNKSKPNMGILALPNLETKFVAANTLIDLPQNNLFSTFPTIVKLREDLEKVRAMHFRANSSRKKTEIQNKDNELRLRIKQESVTLGATLESAAKLADWSPYDKDKSSDWFNPKWMFNIKEFDIVIGNPPYGVSIKGDYRKAVEKSLGKVPDYEIYYYFIDIAYKLLKDNATLSYIIPNTWLFNTFADKYRKNILDHWSVKEILDCSKFEIFESATVRNTINLLTKNTSNNIGYRRTNDVTDFYSLIKKPLLTMPINTILTMNQNWSLAFLLDEKVTSIITKIKTNKRPLMYYFPEISQGLIAYDKYQGQSEDIIKSRAYHYDSYCKDGLKKWLWGADVNRYSVVWNNQEYIDYCVGIANPRDPKFFKGKRILVREITNPSIYAAITEEEMYNDPSILIVKDNNKQIEIILGILNSKLATFYHFNNSPKAIKGAFPKILVKDIKEFPLPDINSSLSQSIKNNVTKILQLVNENDYSENTQKQQAVAEYEKQIDIMVYKLYELTYYEVKTIDSDFTMSEAEYNNFKI